MIAARRERRHAGSGERAVEGLDAAECVVKIHWIGRHVAKVRNSCRVKWRNGGGLIDHPHHAGSITQGARAMTRTGPVGRAAIPGNADNADLHTFAGHGVRRHDVAAA